MPSVLSILEVVFCWRGFVEIQELSTSVLPASIPSLMTFESVSLFRPNLTEMFKRVCVPVNFV